jgi:alpha-N-acetylglucosamine transferase
MKLIFDKVFYIEDYLNKDSDCKDKYKYSYFINKLYCFKLKEYYKKILLMDADTICLRNPDILFDTKYDVSHMRKGFTDILFPEIYRKLFIIL